MIPVPHGFSFAVAAAGLRYQDRNDLAVIYSDRPATAAGTFTTNLVQAAPVTICKEVLADHETARAVLVNAGVANACTGEEGLLNAKLSIELAGDALGLSLDEILPASTGVIGMQMNMDCWRAAAPRLADSLGKAGPMEAAQAIRTTDAFPKTAWAEIEHNGAKARILGLAKGGGMIAPNMATLLGFIMTDAQVDVAWWRQALRSAVQDSFNRITVDGDTSTNDTILALANGAGDFRIDTEPAKQALLEAMTEVCQGLAYMVAQDAEGGTKVAHIHVTGAASNHDAELAARAVGTSPLVKTALFGQDPNWGRIVCAVGRSGATFDPDRLTLHFGKILVYREGRPVAGDLDGLLAPLMRLHDIDINISLGDGPGQATILGADLGHEYVRINGDYRT